MKYHLMTLGCQMNLSDSERLKSVIESMGYTWTDDENEAQILGILACSVRQKAINKVYNKIYVWNRRKDSKNLLTFLSGCILPADKTKFLKLFDLVFHMSELPKLPEIIKQYGIVTPASLLESNRDVSKSFNNLGSFWNISPKYNSSIEAFVPIQNGCDKFCTFCAVPYTRGREISRPSEEILKEVEMLIDNGYKSITLLGQNVNSYGLDKKGDEISFPELLRKIGEMGNKSSKEFWVYFTSPHPRDMTDDVIHTIAEFKCLAKQIHLPVQSGDDKILLKMNRNHDIDRYRKIVDTIRKYLPEATLFTDIIVGFTGETDEQFNNSVKIMSEFRYNMAYIAMYSPRPGAVSARWEDDIPLDLKKSRLSILTEELKKYSHEYTTNMMGKVFRVLVTKREKNGYISGLTEGRINVRFRSDDHSQIDNFADIKIESVTPFSAEGTLVHHKSRVLTEI